MPRRLYIWLLQLHPAGFRQRFGDEILDIFDRAAGPRAIALLMADVLRSLIRQWAFRSEFHQPPVAIAPLGGSTNVPLFRTMDAYKPRPMVLFQGGLLSVVILCAAVGMIGKGGKARAFLIGSHHQSPHVLPVDRASVAESELNSTVQVAPLPEDPWHAIASVYFKAICLLYALDADHDLALSPWEISTAPAALRKLDTNHDGHLSAEECGFSLGANARFPSDFVERARREFMRAHPVLAALDADHDGMISTSEILASSAALKKLDRNGDGSLAPDELIPDRAVTQASVIMVWLDANGDGILSRTEQESENAQPLREILQSADRNHDGLITREELQRELRLRSEQKRGAFARRLRHPTRPATPATRAL